MARQLIVLPDDTAKPFVDAVDNAKKSIRVKMFLFSHAGLIDAVIRAKKRGVEVRVMLNPARRSGKAKTRRRRRGLRLRESKSKTAIRRLM